MSDYNYVSYMDICPVDIKPDDAIALQVVAVAGHGKSWAAYMGMPNWDSNRVASEGDKLPAECAERLFPQFVRGGWWYRN